MIFNESVVSAIAWSQPDALQLSLGIRLLQGFYPQQEALIYTQNVGPFYGSLVGADNYFKTRLNTQSWDYAEKDERLAALHMATRHMEVLNFRGQRANPNQLLFFPRTIDVPGFKNTAISGSNFDGTISDFSVFNNLGTPPVIPDPVPTGTPVVPGEIENACYEIALCFLNGFDPEIEARNLSVTGQGYAGARTTYARDFLQDHLRAGIPSALAWSILRPYLVDPQALRITRGS